jgi:hypothetical protein
MSVIVTYSPEISCSFSSSGILTSSIRPIYAKIEYPNIRDCHPLSSRDTWGPNADFPKGPRPCLPDAR